MSKPPDDRALRLRDLILLGHEPKAVADELGASITWAYWTIRNLGLRRHFITGEEWAAILANRRCKTDTIKQ